MTLLGIAIGVMAIVALGAVARGIRVGFTGMAQDAQALALQPRRVTMLYVKLDDPRQADQFRARVERRFSDLTVVASAEFVNEEKLLDLLDGMAMAVAVIVGGIIMMNTLFMSVFERTHEIGVLRSLGWRRRQVLGMILKESLVLGALGGLCGIPLGLGVGGLIGWTGVWGGAIESAYTPRLFVQAVVIAVVAGVAGGLYPAWRATRMQPVEALTYE